jgi:hypothetical protein
MVRSMLENHPDLAIPPESHFIPPLWERRSRFGSATRIDRPEVFLAELASFRTFRHWDLPVSLVRAQLPPEPRSFADLIDAAFRAYAHREGKSRWADKTPEYVHRIPLLAEAHPGARFVHVVRDGRDVALSMLAMAHMHRRAASAAYFWRRSIRDGRRAADLLGNRYLEVRYEDLVEDPEPAMRAICSLVGLAFDPNVLRHDPTTGARLPVGPRALHASLALPARKRLRDWRTEMAPREVREFEAVARRELAVCGYPLAFPPPGRTTRVVAWSRLAGVASRVGRRRARKLARTGRGAR